MEHPVPTHNTVQLLRSDAQANQVRFLLDTVSHIAKASTGGGKFAPHFPQALKRTCL